MSLPLDESRLRRRLVEQGPYARLVRVDSIGSTNTELQTAAGCPGFDLDWPHLSVLTAEEQTDAAGRLSRGWSSPASSSLSTSVVLRPALAAENLSWLSLVAGRSLVRALRERHGIEAALKWPNDVHIAGRKISGILAAALPPARLAEHAAEHDAEHRRPGSAGRGQRPGVILGCGINVLLTAEQLPTSTSTSVLLELLRAGRPAPEPGTQEAAALRTEVLLDYLSLFAEELAEAERLLAEDPTKLRDRIAEVMDTLGRQVRVELPDGDAARGTAAALAADGALVVEVGERLSSDQSSDQQQWIAVPPHRRSFSAGDVEHLRRVEE